LNHTSDLIIAGGGASGVMAALEARRAGFSGSITLLEKEEQPLRKLLASGNGRCNLANLSPLEGRYRSDDLSLVRSVLGDYPAPLILERFAQLGLLTVEEREGRVYPRSFQARSVALSLLRALDRADIRLLYPIRVLAIKAGPEGFELSASDGALWQARALIAACGSPASPDLGGTADGYRLLESLGHRLHEAVPSQVPLTLAAHPLTRYAQGVRFRGHAAFRASDGTLTESQGEYLFTPYGLSGIAAMELGAAVGRSAGKGGKPGTLTLDFLPEFSKGRIQSVLEASWTGHDDWQLLLAGLVADKIGRGLLAALPSLENLSKEEAAGILAGKLKACQMEVTGTRGFRFAYVAAGGIAAAGFDPATLMSRTQQGLFACGELLDVDGDTGGFNLLWAFSSGCLAGRAAASYLRGLQA